MNKSLLPPHSVKELRAAVVKLGLASQAAGLSEKREYVELLERHMELA